jgi:hypothetical protein
MAEQNRNSMRLVQQYRALVSEYESLDKQIDELIAANGGHSENMSPEELGRYRQLARQRDDIQNEMRALELELQIDDSDSTVS